MFGLYEARRNTEPISSATPVSREIHTWSVAGSIVMSAPQSMHQVRRAPRRRIHRGSTRQSASATLRAGSTAALDGRQSAATTSGAGSDAPDAHATTSIGAPGARDHCGARAGFEPPGVDRELVALTDIPAVDRGLDRCIAPTRRRAAFGLPDAARRRARRR